MRNVRVDSIDILEEDRRKICFGLVARSGVKRRGNHTPPPTITRPWPQHSRLPARGGGRSPPPTTRLNIPHVVMQHRTPTNFDPRNSPPKYLHFRFPPSGRCGGIPLFALFGVSFHEVRASEVSQKRFPVGCGCWEL